MKLKLLTFQIAAAALLAPVAVSLASTTPKSAPQPVAKPAVVLQAAAPTLVAVTPAVAAPKAAASATPAPSCGSKVRVVYAGYAPAPRPGC